MKKRFQPGQIVWSIARDDCENATEVSGHVFLTEFQGVVFCTPVINNHEDIQYILDYLVNETRAEDCCDSIKAYPMEDCYADRHDAYDAFYDETGEDIE